MSVLSFHQFTQVEVVKLPKMYPPDPVKVIQIGKHFDVTCTVGEEESVEFFYQGGYLSEGHDPSIRYNKSGKIFTVERASYSHDGTVFMFASNEAGTTVGNTTVVIWDIVPEDFNITGKWGFIWCIIFSTNITSMF